ncbi:peptidyl-tRNA hydrolase, mitochondrial-like [Chenopodium quinoa]|uniref:peptidyl-tRNA hydrolase, mitochondrial-like n=1 Tax=Chenopodium quinoa TaxID=63459 RepID=UPI000B78A553|nr:peptidyl-tRNA hydrolase, mitochondrial-like [Chenopodium quinoa]
MLRCLSRESSAVRWSLSKYVNPPLPWLFMGLGNPGDKFKGTRHNVSFEMIDALADSLGISLNNVHCKALFAQGFIGNVPIFLAKPQTYMNLCGTSTGPLAAYYKLPLNRVMVMAFRGRGRGRGFGGSDFKFVKPESFVLFPVSI